LPKDPSYNEADVSDKPADIRDSPLLSPTVEAANTERYQQRLEALLALDEAVGQMMATLTATGELATTIIAFTSDNGSMLGEHRVVAGKVLPYEPSAQVPFVVRGPGFPVGVTRDQLAAHIDLAPTFMDAANTQAGLEVDGTSLLPLAADPAVAMGRSLIVEAGPRAVGEPMFYTGVRTGQWLYVEYDTGEVEFYNQVNDPYQLQSLHADPAYDAQRMELAANLAMLRNCAGVECRAGPDDGDGDGVLDATDNCPTAPNADQADDDGDGIGDTCDGTVQLSIYDTSASEGAGAATFVVTLSSPTAAAVTVDYATTDRSATAGQDYTASTGTLSFAPGDTTKQLPIGLLEDSLGEPDETFMVTLGNPSLGLTIVDGMATGTIVNDEDSTPPTVTKKTPPPRATSIILAANVTATFNEPVGGVSDKTFTLTDSSSTSPIPATVTYNATTRVATLNPTAKLAVDTKYTATVLGGATAIKDSAGNPLVDTKWTFVTGPAPTVTRRTPAPAATAVSQTANVTVTFREPVKAVSETTFTLTSTATGAQPIVASVSRSGTTNKWILDPTASLDPNTTYTVVLTGGPTAIRDLADNPLISTSWSFTTGLLVVQIG